MVDREPVQDDLHSSSTDLNEASTSTVMSSKKHDDGMPLQTYVENHDADKIQDASGDFAGNEPPVHAWVLENEGIVNPVDKASTSTVISSKKHDDDKPMQICVGNPDADEIQEASDHGVGNEPPVRATVPENGGTGNPAEATTQDSDRRCDLLITFCNDLMDQLQRNSGLVLKTSGPDGEILLHVAVVDKKLKGPVSAGHIKCGLIEADVGSVWYDALQKRDCMILMAELAENHGLLLQTGPQGMTVLHATVMRGCVQLLQQVLDYFGDETAEFVDVQLGRRCSQRHLLNAKYGDSKSTTYDLVTLYFGADLQSMCNIKDVKLAILRAVDNEKVLFVREREKHKVYWALSKAREKLSEITEKASTSEAFSHLEPSFVRDCDYNFVSEQKELCFHYACQEYHRNEFARDYVRLVIKLGMNTNGNFYIYLFGFKNAQGRTPLHAWVNASWWCVPDSVSLLLEIYGIVKKCLNVYDARGWTILHMAAAGGFDNLLRYILKDGRAKVEARTNNKAASTALHLAILHNRRECVELLSNRPISGGKESGFIEADASSKWYKALSYGWCGTLMKVLAKDRGRILQTGPKGMTVLHVAVMEGCIPLLEQALHIFDETVYKIVDAQSGRMSSICFPSCRMRRLSV